MATLQVRDIDDGLYATLKMLADKEHRSLSQEVVNILESHVRQPNRKLQDITGEFLSLSDAWQDDRSASSIVKEIRQERKNSRRYGDSNVIFD